MISLLAKLTATLAAGSVLGEQPPADYSDEANWLCRPDRDDACAVDLDSTVVTADGTLTVERHQPADQPGFDCFYVYPTISNDPGPVSGLAVTDAERRVVEQQFARFGEICRTYAPMYRQVTLTALRSANQDRPMEGVDREIGYADIKAAWRHYLDHDNAGRGVLLIGHSQGSGVLRRLIAEEIDGAPIQDQMIAAYLIGTTVSVPRGETSGGDFTSVPVCSDAEETGCVISFAAYRSDSPPSQTGRFGVVPEPGMQAICVNPAELLGRGDALHAYLDAHGREGSVMDLPGPWTVDGAVVRTSFVQAPGLLTAQCVEDRQAHYLSVSVQSDPSSPRADDIVGDVVLDGTRVDAWGLHMIDIHLTQGDLISLARRQADAWAGGGQ